MNTLGNTGNVYYKISKQDEKEFDDVITALLDVKHRKVYDPYLLICEEEAESRLGYRIFADDYYYHDKDENDKIECIQDIADLRDTMYGQLICSRDCDIITQTFDQVFKLWRNSRI